MDSGSHNNIGLNLELEEVYGFSYVYVHLSTAQNRGMASERTSTKMQPPMLDNCGRD